MSVPRAATEPAQVGRERLLRASIDYFAEHGIGDASLRQIASAIDSSHRMLIYHFGSREGVLEAVVEELERAERDVLNQILRQDDRPGRERAWDFWTHVADVVDFYGPLYFELASRAMRSSELVVRLRFDLVEGFAAAPDFGEDVVGGGFPDEGSGISVPVLCPGGDRFAEFMDAGEGSAA